jgi:hypothetical protein
VTRQRAVAVASWEVLAAAAPRETEENWGLARVCQRTCGGQHGGAAAGRLRGGTRRASGRRTDLQRAEARTRLELAAVASSGAMDR